MITAEDIRRVMEADEENETYEYEELCYSSKGEVYKDFGGLGDLTVEDSKYGYEGYGEGPTWIVVSILDGYIRRYFRQTGRYASFAGNEWNDDWTEVEPYQRQVTDYRVV